MVLNKPVKKQLRTDFTAGEIEDLERFKERKGIKTNHDLQRYLLLREVGFDRLWAEAKRQWLKSGIEIDKMLRLADVVLSKSAIARFLSPLLLGSLRAWGWSDKKIALYVEALNEDLSVDDIAGLLKAIEED